MKKICFNEKNTFILATASVAFAFLLCLILYWIQAPSRQSLSAEAKPEEEVIPDLQNFEYSCVCDAMETDHHLFYIKDFDSFYCIPCITTSDGLTMGCLDVLCQLYGYDYLYEPNYNQSHNNTITLTKENSSIVINAYNGEVMSSTGYVWIFPQKVTEKCGRFFVPLRYFIEEVLNSRVKYIQKDSDQGAYLLSGSPDCTKEDFETYLNGAYEEIHYYTHEGILERCMGEETFQITFYHDSTKYGNSLASGARGYYGAVAADKKYPFKTQFYIPELDFIAPDGIFTVEDRGGAVHDNILDLYIPLTAEQIQESDNEELKIAYRAGRFNVTGYQMIKNE